MSDDFIKMINDIDFSYGFIYEYADLVNNLYDHYNYDHLAIKLYRNFVLPIINITKDEHIKEYNEHIENNKYINWNCSYLMNICSERYFQLSKEEYSKIKKFIDNNIDTFESILAPIHDSINLCRKCYDNYYYHIYNCNCYYKKIWNECICITGKYSEFCEKSSIILKRIIISYLNLEYIKFFYLLQKVIGLNINNDILVNIFINLYDNSNIGCNERTENKICDLYLYLKRTKDIYGICSYLMNICCERYFKLSRDEYLKIKEFIDNNIDIIESSFAPMSDYFDLYKKCYNHYYCSCYYYHKKKVKYIFSPNRYKEFHEKIIKLYFNIEYIKFFYLLQKDIRLNKRVYNTSVLIDIFMNLYNNSNIDCNKKNKNKLYDLHNNIVLNKFVYSNKYENNFIFGNYK